MKCNTNNGQSPGRDDDDDLRAWIVIGLIFFVVTLAVCGPVIWIAAHGTL
jgi:hypothetical protein